MEKSKLFLVFLIINLIFLNSAFVFLYFRPRASSPPSPSLPDISPLQAEIDQLKSDILIMQNNFATPSAISPSPVKQTASSPLTSYIPVPGSGQLLVYQWTKIPGTEFYFNPADFPNLDKAFFEANMKLLNGNGQAFLRLFDLTAGIEIWGSEVQTANQDNTIVVSSPLTFRSGNHLICVQTKSLTADTTVFNSGRLKIISR